MADNWPHRAAYMKAYNARPEQVKKRMQRNRARREYEQLFGDLPSNVDVHHKRMIKEGGSNARSNLQASPVGKNRAWRKGHSGY